DPPRESTSGVNRKSTDERLAASTSATEAGNAVSSIQSVRKTGKAGSLRAGANAVESQQLPISEARELAAIQFAREHHQELAELLEGLRKVDDRNFQAGLRALTRDTERLVKLADRDEERYPVALDLWKLDSRIRLETARLSMSPSEDFEPRLRPMMEQQQAIQIELLQLDRKRLSERLTRFDEHLKTLQAMPDELIAAEIARLQKLVAVKARTKSTRAETSKQSSKPTAKSTTSRAATADQEAPGRK
ncbi:MAG: hypothetical protein O3B86_11700, partial [Planctomycetota bacterium]|nr:hypothetical protein [Planctomycetota bacterium]